PGEPGYVLRVGLQEAADVAAAREMPTQGSQHDHPYALIFVQRFEYEAQLIALGHFDDIERRPVEDDGGSLPGRVNLDAEAMERGKARVGERQQPAHTCDPFWVVSGGACSASYSPATSLRRSSLPTGDLGTASTNT